MEIKSRLTMQVSNCHSTSDEDKVKNAMKEAIADSLTGVSADQVIVRSVACTVGGRRLHGLGARRLTGSLVVDYEIHVPSGVTAPKQSDMSTMTLKTNVNSRLSQQGVTDVVTSSVRITTFAARFVTSTTFIDSALSGTRKGATNVSITAMLGLLAATFAVKRRWDHH
jgi:hypothetical protein